MSRVLAGSGKKYKKCCLNKLESQILTPADKYIENSLKDYPKEGLKKFYDEERILIDEKLYRALKHKLVPIFIKRNYEEETRRDLKNMEEAIELIKVKCQKENINTIDKFNNKISIHYNLELIIDGYLNLLNNIKNEEYEKIQKKKAEFLIQMIQIFNFDERYKRVYISNFIDDYLECEDYFYAEKIIKEFIKQLPDMEKYLSIKLSQIYLKEEEKLDKILEPINNSIEKFNLDEELELNRIVIYYEYAYLSQFKNDDNEVEIYLKLWNFTKEFLKNKNIKNEDEYNKKVEEEYYYYNILNCIENFYKKNGKKYIKERIEFLNEALKFIKIEEETKELLISGLAYAYCDYGDKNKAISLIDDFIKEYPNNSGAILTKSNIYINEDEPDYENAISIIEDSLKNDNIDSKYALFGSLALLYEKIGNKKEAHKYQILAGNQEDELPF